MSNIADSTPYKYQSTTNEIKSSNDYDHDNKEFCGKGIAPVSLMVIPHIVMNIGLGAIKGLEVGIRGPARYLSNKGKGIGAPESKLSKFCSAAGIFAGALVTIVIAVPSLLLGTACGLVRIVVDAPQTVKKCRESGFCDAARRTINFYQVFNSNLSCNFNDDNGVIEPI